MKCNFIITSEVQCTAGVCNSMRQVCLLMILCMIKTKQEKTNYIFLWIAFSAHIFFQKYMGFEVSTFWRIFPPVLRLSLKWLCAGPTFRSFFELSSESALQQQLTWHYGDSFVTTKLLQTVSGLQMENNNKTDATQSVCSSRTKN